MSETNEFDPYDKETLKRGPEAYVELGRKCPVHHNRERFDFFIASDYNDVTQSILKDSNTWSIEDGSPPKALPDAFHTGLMTDPPYHQKIRQVVQRGFGQTQLARLSKEIDRIADELIDRMLAVPEGEGDFYTLFASPLPARLMCVMLGTPEKDYEKYKAWADSFFYSINNDASTSPEEDAMSAHVVTEPLFGLLTERQALLESKGLTPDLKHVGTVLPDDFLSRFMCDKIDGKPLNPLEILSLMMGILVGGNETTMNLIGNLLWRLLEVPERWETLKANPNLIETAIEESLRIDPPVLGLCRTAKHDVTLQGQTIRKDAKVMYNIAAVNRNPEFWENPDEFRLDRPLSVARRHVSLSGGPHSCLGAPLARMEVRMVFEKLVKRIPGLAMAGEAERIKGFNAWGKTYLPVRWR